MDDVSKIRELISANLDNKEVFQCFHIGEFVQLPGHMGCFERQANWYWFESDEKNECMIIGPFNLKGIIYACAVRMNFSKRLKEYKFTQEEYQIFFNNHFHTFSEIDEYVKKRKEQGKEVEQ